MLIAEELLLLLTDDTTGAKSADSTKFPYALGGAILLELSMTGRVDVAEKGEQVKAGRLVIRDGSPTDDAVLDLALERLAKREGRKPRDVISHLSKGLADALYERLTERGVLRLEESKVLGVFGRKRWPAADVEHESVLRAAIVDAVTGSHTSIDPRIGALVSLLSAIDKVPMVVVPGQVGLTKGEIRKRGKQIADQAWAPAAVKQAVDAVNAAMTAAMVATTVAATSSS